MQLENSFQVAAPPDKVFAYLLDVNKIVGCVPGAELTEVVDDSTFKGKVKVKVGPITVAYSGTARISERNDAERKATLSADGRETTGPGSARASAVMSVLADGGTSRVTIVTEYHVAGRVAQFGRGVMEDVSKRLINQMAACIQANLKESPVEPTSGPAPAETKAIPASPPTSAPRQTASQINAFGLLVHLIRVRLQRLFGRAS